jgi:aspartate/tyrosine/aromatic aminotransferase
VRLQLNHKKNLGLYAERAGTFSMVCSSAEEKERVLSQIKRVIRPLYSSPPIQYVCLKTTATRKSAYAVLSGAQLVATILGTPELYDLWCVIVSHSVTTTSRTDAVQALRGQENGRQDHRHARQTLQPLDRAQDSRRMGTHQVSDRYVLDAIGTRYHAQLT